jgi:hypothetical protein
VRVLAVDKTGQPLADLKSPDLRVRLNKLDRKILSTSDLRGAYLIDLGPLPAGAEQSSVPIESTRSDVKLLDSRDWPFF